MKIVVIGGTSLISTRVGAQAARGRPRSRSAALGSGVNVLTGVGLAAAFARADVAVDVTNSPSFPRGEGS